MHSYYAENKEKIKKGIYHEVFREIWDYYEENLLDKFLYIGGDN